MTELWLDQALMELAYKCDITVSSFVGNPVALLWLALFIDFLIQKKKTFFDDPASIYVKNISGVM